MWDESPAGQLKARDEMIAREAANVPAGCSEVGWRRVVDVTAARFWEENPDRRDMRRFLSTVADQLAYLRGPVTTYAKARTFRYSPRDAWRNSFTDEMLSVALMHNPEPVFITKACRAYEGSYFDLG